MTLSADLSRVPVALNAEVPQVRGRWHVVEVSDLATAAAWLLALPVFALLFLLQFGLPYVALWILLPIAFGKDVVTVHDGVIEATHMYRCFRLPTRRVIIRDHSDLTVNVAEAQEGRFQVQVCGAHAVPVVLRGRLTTEDATVLADALTACIAYAMREGYPFRRTAV